MLHSEALLRMQAVIWEAFGASVGEFLLADSGRRNPQ